LHVALISAPFDAFVESESDREYLQVNQYQFNDEYEDVAASNNGTRMTREAWDCMKKVAKVSDSFNFDDSDGQIDYFHTNYYLHLYVGKWSKPYQKKA